MLKKISNPEKFNELFEKMLGDFQANPEKDVDIIIAKSLKEVGASEETLQKVAETGEIIDKIQEKVEELDKAMEAGSTRERWLAGEIARIAETQPECEREDILKVFAQASETVLEQELNTEE